MNVFRIIFVTHSHQYWSQYAIKKVTKKKKELLNRSTRPMMKIFLINVKIYWQHLSAVKYEVPTLTKSIYHENKYCNLILKYNL